ncbi:hypothetical protein ABW19_dt0210174 [Dactylella cylindrospora]|nr:hypothetical protein ABW19_dt0210174 [Dactylella cylindrospora]
MVNPLRYVAHAGLVLVLCQQAVAIPIALSTAWEVITITSCKSSTCTATTMPTDYPTMSSTSTRRTVTSTTTITKCPESSSSSTSTSSSSSSSSSSTSTSSSATPTSSPPPTGNPARDRNWKTINHIYNLTIFPNQVPIITMGGAAVPDGLFAEHATGRISPVGNFTDFEDSIEYFFALPPLPISNKNSAAFTRFEVVQFSSECPEVAASTVYLYASVVNTTSPDNGKLISILKQTGFWRFNARGEVVNYDLALIEVDHFISELTSTDYDDPQAQRDLIETTCNTQALRCVGVNREYDSIEQCIEILSQKPFGSYTNVWSDSVVCRSIHLVLTLTRPDAHCAHVGPTGGMKCVDYDYQQRQFFDDEHLFGGLELFRCPGYEY